MGDIGRANFTLPFTVISPDIVSISIKIARPPTTCEEFSIFDRNQISVDRSVETYGRASKTDKKSFNVVALTTVFHGSCFSTLSRCKEISNFSNVKIQRKYLVTKYTNSNQVC